MARPEAANRYDDRKTFLDIMGTMLKYVLIIVLILVFIRLSQKAYAIGYAVFSEETVDPAGSGTEVAVEITSSMTVNDIGTLLESDGLLKDGSVFPFQERFSSWHGEIMPGTYQLSSDQTPDEMLETMAANYSEGDTGAENDIGKALREVLFSG